MRETGIEINKRSNRIKLVITLVIAFMLVIGIVASSSLHKSSEVIIFSNSNNLIA